MARGKQGFFVFVLFLDVGLQGRDQKVNVGRPDLTEGCEDVRFITQLQKQRGSAEW